MALGFTPTRAYVPSMPTTLSTIADRMPALLDRAESTLRTLTEIIDRVPGSLDRSDRFFTNVERIIRESDLPGLSADSRKFFSATTAQIEEVTANMDKLIGTGGTLAKFTDDARAAINAAEFPAVSQVRRAMPWTRRASQPTIFGARCRRSESRSNSSASLRDCFWTNRSRWSMARAPRKGRANELGDPVRVRVARGDRLRGGCRLPAPPS